MEKKIRWGVLSTAAIGLKKVVPAMQRCEFASIDAICSRDLAKSKEAAFSLGIPKAYGSYEDLLADPDIDAIYNPLPNHLHVPWTIKAAEAGKHVLCEKPISLTEVEASTLLGVREHTGVKIGEAFMVRVHPQWLRAKELIATGVIGELRAFFGFFSYYNVDPQNIRNRVDLGGGALMDIGCYLVQASRFAFDGKPARVVASMQRDPEMGTDRLTSVLMEYPSGQVVFTCSTQLAPYQRMHFMGTKGRIELEVPVNVPPDKPPRMLVDTGQELFGGGATVEMFGPLDQYTLQGDAFSRAILDNTEVPVSVEDAIENMAVIDAIFRSAKTGGWEVP